MADPGHRTGTGGSRAIASAARLVSDVARVRVHLGRANWDELTYARIFRDSIQNTTPVIVEAGSKATVVVNISDSCALSAAPSAGPFESWGRYFDWNQPQDLPGRTFAEAVRSVAGPGTLAIGADLPLTRYVALAATGPVELVAAQTAEEPVFVHRKARAEIEAQWDVTRTVDGEAISGFVAKLRRGAALLEAMRAPATGYAPLDALMQAKRLAAFLVTSPFNAELFTGLPAATGEQLGVTCLFVPGEDDIFVLSRFPLRRSDLRPEGKEPSLAKAVAVRLGGQAFGVEGGHLPIGLHAALEAEGCVPIEAIATLRRWQDMRAGTDLPYFIIAANAVLHGLAHASEHIARHIGPGLTERDADAAFDQGVADFLRRLDLPDRAAPYFGIIHSGERTLLPALAGDYPLREDHQTIKFDMGILVKDAHGCVRGCSDIARSLSPDAAVRHAHDRLRSALVDRLIPAMRPGMSGGEIHAAGVDALRDCVPALREAGLLPEGRGVEDYVRDCGHTIHRTTAGSVYFLPGIVGTIEPGMLGCVEFVWPIGDRIVAVEDGYYVTETDVIPFTI